MNEKKLIYPIIFLTVLIALNLYCIFDMLKKFYDIHECGHQTSEIVFSVNEKIGRNLKEMKYLILKEQDEEKLELTRRNYELEWQLEKMTNEFLNLFNLLRGREMPLNRSFGKTNV